MTRDDPRDKVRSQLAEGLQHIKRRTRFLSEFKNFIARGSALDLAIGVVIGAAFNGVVQSLVKDVLTPIVSWPGRADFNGLTACLKDAVPVSRPCLVPLRYGAFVTSIISFLLTAAAVFFFVVRPLSKMRAWRRNDETPAQPMRACPECLTEIPAAARRCAHCTVPLPAG